MLFVLALCCVGVVLLQIRVLDHESRAYVSTAPPASCC
jgi:hypothetical protein